MQSLQPVIKQLETLFSKFNDRFYDGKLPKPVITVSPDSTKGAYGWCTSWKAWTDKENADMNEGYYEINLCAEYLSRPIELVCVKPFFTKWFTCSIWNRKFRILPEVELITISGIRKLLKIMV